MSEAGTVTPPRPKPGLHPRNRDLAGYDFPTLAAASPGLARYVITTAAGTPGIDFANPAAVKAFNRALLIHHYGIHGWDIPAGYLCPPVPGRADYIHHAADLLATCNRKVIPTGPRVRIVDIGVGANCIYPLIGHGEYGWRFLGVDIDPPALANAQRILAANPELAAAIELRHQPVQDNIFVGMLRSGESFELSICNPPFHNSPGDVMAVARRKWNNLGKGSAQPGSQPAAPEFRRPGHRTLVRGRRTRLPRTDGRAERRHPEALPVVHQPGVEGGKPRSRRSGTEEGAPG